MIIIIIIIIIIMHYIIHYNTLEYIHNQNVENK